MLTVINHNHKVFNTLINMGIDKYGSLMQMCVNIEHKTSQSTCLSPR